MTMSPFDIENLGEILAGHGDWFNAKLLRLIALADSEKRKAFHKAFPVQVDAITKYQTGKGWNEQNK